VNHARSRVVIVGAGHAGDTFAARIRQAGFTGEVIVFGEEPHLPYHRPPLSKEFLPELAGRWLRDPRFYAEQAVTLRLAEAVAMIDRAAGTVVTASSRLSCQLIVSAACDGIRVNVVDSRA